jgi:hypothetical protein
MKASLMLGKSAADSAKIEGNTNRVRLLFHHQMEVHMKIIVTLACATFLAATPAFAQSSMGGQSDSVQNQDSASNADQTNSHQKRGAKRARAQAGTVSNGSGTPSSTRDDTVSTSASGKGKNDPTNPAASGAATGSPKNF